MKFPEQPVPRANTPLQQDTRKDHPDILQGDQQPFGDARLAKRRPSATHLIGRLVTETDLQQALVRPILLIAGLSYVAQFAWPEAIYPDSIVAALGFSVFAGIVIGASLLILGWAYWQPGQSKIRSFVALAIDAVATAMLLSSAGEEVTPILFLVFWYVTGYGLRYGRAMLALACASSLAMIAWLSATNPYWQASPHFVVLVVLTLVALPSYAVHLASGVVAANLRLRKSIDERSRMLARASHDLRHPLHAVGIFLEALRESDLDDEQKVLVDKVGLSVRNTRELLQTYLDASAVDAGTLTVKPKPVRVQELFDELSDQVRAPAERSGNQFCFMRTSKVTIADRTMLKAILQNLITNVIRHAPGARVVIGCRLDGNHYAIQVRDDGGTKPTGQETAALNSPANRGLGFGIIKDLVDAQGFEIFVRDDMERGFDIRLCNLPQAPAAVLNEARGQKPNFQPLRGTRVLLVNPDPETRAAMTSLLDRWGCTVTPRSTVDGELPIADLAVIDATKRMKVPIRTLEGLAIPVIVIRNEAPKRRLRIKGSQVIEAVSPVPPAALRSMMMAAARSRAA